MPGISQLPLDLGLSCFIVNDPSAASRFGVVSFAGTSTLQPQSGCGCFVALDLPGEIRFGFGYLSRISFLSWILCFIMRHLSDVARFRVQPFFGIQVPPDVTGFV